jgi:hypothetical protein
MSDIQSNALGSGMPDRYWGQTCEWLHLISQWLKIHIVPVAPLITAFIATIAGIVAVISIIVTKQLARRRAAIDFFLKTEADKSMVEIFQRFDESLDTVNQAIDAGKKTQGDCEDKRVQRYSRLSEYS